ncbi:MAG: hypothetical protein HFI53_12945 [Lachnospiraceae bacterium]|nr:hypothetical protein [Lachnospiraceae bacterium]
MFRYEYPIFEHKNLLKKSMLDELRDYPLSLSRMYFAGYGDGILEGCGLSWENDVLYLETGLLHYQSDIYRMEEPCPLECPPTDQLTYLKVRFATMDYERGKRSGMGEILLSAIPAESGEMELGRFRLQEGARLRTAYENFEDYQTEYDTVNRIHAPYAGAGGAGMWPQLLKVYAKELLETGTKDVHDVSFAMTVLGADGKVSPECIRWYLLRSGDEVRETLSNGECYKKLLNILKIRKSGGTGWKQPEGGRGQMILL